MITAATKSGSHYISPSALTFTENYQGQADIVHVSLVLGSSIKVFLPGEEGLGYGVDADYQRWRLSGVTVKLNDSGADKQFNIYARLQRSKKEADIIFSLREYTVRGSYTENGEATEDSDQYWYIKIGYLTAPVNEERTLYYDSGELGTRKNESENNALFELLGERIKPRYVFDTLTVAGEAIFKRLVSFANGFSIGSRMVTSVANDDDATDSEQSREQIATPSFVQRHGDHRYLNKLSSEAQSVASPVTFLADLTVKGAITAQSVTANDISAKTLDISGEATFREGLHTAEWGHEAGQVRGAQLTREGLFYASGIIANSFKITELIYNAVRAQGGKTTLSNAATIESCIFKVKGSEDMVSEYVGDVADIEYVLLTIKADENNKGANPFRSGDILYGHINNISDDGGVSDGGECTMHVTDIPDEARPMVVKAELYPINEELKPTDSNYYEYVSSNIAPTPGITLAQRGSITDENRRSSIFLDAENGDIIMLQNVSTPRIRKEYYGTVSGILPGELWEEVNAKFEYFKKTDPVVFAEYGIFKNILQYDNSNNLIRRENNRGEWTSGVTYENTASYYDVVSYGGQLWKCVASSTTAQPQSGSSDWLLLVSKGADGKASTPNLLDNTGFDSVGADGAPLSWSKSEDTTVKIVDKSESGLGQNVISLYHPNGEEKMIAQQLISGRLQPYTWYTLSFYIKKMSFFNRAMLSLDNYNKSEKIYFDGEVHSDNNSNISFTISENWEKHTATFQTDSTSTDVLICFGARNYRQIEYHIGQVKLELASDQSAPEKSTPSDWLRNTDDYTSESIYPAGNWDSSKTYRKENNCVPVVKYNGQYYRLTRVESTGNTPSDLTHWKPFQYFQHLFAEFLMANNAKFGSDKGAIFFNKWLFSQMGRTRDGVNKSYDEFIEEKQEYEEVFDTDGNFTGDFTPNFSLDMEDGEMSLLKLKENYVDCTEMTYIDMDDLGYYNIIVEPKVQQKRFGFSSPLIILPQQGGGGNVRDKQGARISIVAKADQYYLKQYSADNSGTTGTPTGKNYQCGAFALICAETLVDMKKYDNGNYQSNWIISYGYRSKYIYLGAGDSITLRLVVMSDGNDHYNYWYVEAGDVIHGTDNIVLVNNAESKIDYEGKPFDGNTIGVIDTMKYTNSIDRSDNWKDNSIGNDYKRCLFCSPAAFDNRGDLVAGAGTCRTIILSVNSDGFVPYSSNGVQTNVYYRHVDSRIDGDKGFDTQRETN